MAMMGPRCCLSASSQNIGAADIRVDRHWAAHNRLSVRLVGRPWSPGARGYPSSEFTRAMLRNEAVPHLRLGQIHKYKDRRK